VETDGRDTNRTGSSGVDNVVPFPRDWIGPLDDLVPIGTSAEGGTEDEEIAGAFAADAFWSEGSASLHQVIEAPAQPGAAEEASRDQSPVLAAEAGGFDRSPVAARRVRRVARLAHGGRFRMTALGAAAAFVAAAVGLVLELGSPSPAAGHHAALAAGAQLRGVGNARSSASNIDVGMSRLLVARAIERTSRSSRGSGRSETHRHVAAHKAPAGSSGGSATQGNVSYEVSQPTSTAPSVASTSQSSEGSGTAGQSSASSATHQSSSSSSSGPVGAGAPFGPGQMTGG
jgi:hypothetical protein